jgi:hypothetical protein
MTVGLSFQYTDGFIDDDEYYYHELGYPSHLPSLHQCKNLRYLDCMGEAMASPAYPQKPIIQLRQDDLVEMSKLDKLTDLKIAIAEADLKLLSLLDRCSKLTCLSVRIYNDDRVFRPVLKPQVLSSVKEIRVSGDASRIVLDALTQLAPNAIIVVSQSAELSN